MRNRLWTVVVIVGVCCLPQPPARAIQALTASNTRTFTHARLGLTVVAADVTLPAGQWQIAATSPANALDQVFLMPRALANPGDVSRRVSAATVQRSVDSGRWRVQQFHSGIVDYARTHGGVGPKTIDELARTQWAYLHEAFSQSPWPQDRASRPGPYYFIVPSTPIPPSVAGRPPSKGSLPLVLELHPYINDGKHWVLFANGSVERVAVDKALLARYRLTLQPVRPDGGVAGAADPSVVHSVFAIARGGASAPVSVTLTEAASARKLDVQWTLAGSRSDPQALTDWARAREGAWWGLLDHGEEAPILRAWMARSRFLYGSPQTPPMNRADDMAMMMRRDEPRTTDMFGVLGGRAALRETLQMQLLRTEPVSGGFGSVPSIAISTLKGVEVASLPFESMLAGRTGGSLPLADRVPADRLMVHFSTPAALFPFLDKGGDFLARAGSFYTASAFDDDLKARYLRRLGLGERAGRAFIESGGVTELALVASDLFFIDGTDVTILMRVKSPDLVAGGLRLLGIADVAEKGITEKPTVPGRSAFWARQGDLLMVGSSRKDVEQILQLGTNAGAGSLGRTAEFRYMLTEVPVRAETRALVYLSDPFIRRMVSPAVKIGQVRRMQARADMVIITAGALLYRLDGRRDTPTLPRLIDLGYVPASITTARYALRDDLSVVSLEWGTLADLKSIDSVAVQTVTPGEAEAYQNYMNEYTQFWRQFFDPIALRLDDAPNGELELSTFILPLIDSELYNGVRGFFQPAEGGGKLRVPVLSPEPVAQISLDLTDSAWIGLSGDMGRMFSEYTGISPEVFDLLGPGLHIAIQDADPIIATGTGDLLGAFSSPMGGMFGGGFDMMMPFAISLFTRPCKIMVELQDPKRALELLRLAGTRSRGPNPFRQREVEFRQIEGRDAWIYTFGVPGLVTVRLGLEIQNGFLVLSNTPWAKPVTIQSADARPYNGASIRVAPDAVKEGLAGLFATQAENEQMATLSSMAALLPLLQAGSATPADAAAQHATLFGSRPLHPKVGEWRWANGKLESSVYGSPTQWRMPLYKPEMGSFGLFDGTTLLDLNMQFESGGLRAAARWKWKD